MELVARLKSLANDRRRRMLVVAASVALVVLIAVTLARLVWLVVAGPALPPVATPVATVQAAPARARHTPEQTRDWRLFGDAAAVPAGTADGAADAPNTSLSLQLLGTFSTTDQRLAGAVIAERGKDGELFRLGAPVPGGATLEKVEADKVILRRRGQLETLRFDVSSSGAGAPASETGKGMDMATGFRNLKERLHKPPQDDGGSDAGDAASRARSSLGALADDLATNPEGVLNELGLKPVGGEGGYSVGDGASADLMRNLGLRPGDVILSVNSKPLGDVRNDTKMIDEVKASGEARVEIRRGSQTFTVNYPL